MVRKYATAVVIAEFAAFVRAPASAPRSRRFSPRSTAARS